MAWSLRLCLYLGAAASAFVLDSSALGETLLVEFRSPTCGPCRSMQPIVDGLSAEGYAIKQVDVTAQPNVASQFHIDGVPTFVVLVDGREQARLVGSTSRSELVDMIHNAAALDGGSRRRPNDSFVAPVGLASHSQPAGLPTTFAGGERIVALEEPEHPAAAPRRATGPGPPASAPHGGADVLPATAAANLIAATVRISVDDAQGKSTGTGTVIDCRQGSALIITCGHLFRESGGKGDIAVEQFVAGPGGAEVKATIPGRLLTYDLQRDLALIVIRPAQAIAAVAVAPAGAQLAPGASVTSVGCDHGANPTPWATRIVSLNRYQGTPNVEAAGAPVEGRSGGGLFNAQGQLIGVCFAAEPKDNEGLYASLPAIQAKLDELKLSMVYQSPVGSAASAVASADAPRAIRGQDPASSSQRDLGRDWPDAPSKAQPASFVETPAAAPPVQPAATMVPQSTTLATGAVSTSPPASAGELSANDRAVLEELQRRGADAEVICIIRPRTPDGRSEVIKLSGASPALVAALEAASHDAPRTAVAPGTSAMR